MIGSIAPAIGLAFVVSVFACHPGSRTSRPAPLRVRPASLRAGSFLLLVQEKRPKRRTPQRRRPRGVLPRGFVLAGRGSPTALPCAVGEHARNVRASLRAIPSDAHRRQWGPEKSSALPARRLGSDPAFVRGCCFGFCGQDDRAVALPGPLWAAASARRQGPTGGGAMDRAEFAVSTRTCCRQTQERAREVARAGSARDRGREGVLSFGSFSLDEQRKGTGPQGCGTNAQGREPAFSEPAPIITTSFLSPP